MRRGLLKVSIVVARPGFSCFRLPIKYTNIRARRKSINFLKNISICLFFLTGAQGGVQKRRVVVALYDYKSRDESDLSFMKGDRMEVVDDTESDWWRVINLTTRQEGLIPLNFVAEERSVNSEE